MDFHTWFKKQNALNTLTSRDWGMMTDAWDAGWEESRKISTNVLEKEINDLRSRYAGAIYAIQQLQEVVPPRDWKRYATCVMTEYASYDKN